MVPWVESVQRSARLRVHFQECKSENVSYWEPLIGVAMREFNALSCRHRLGVLLESVGDDSAEILVQSTRVGSKFQAGGRFCSLGLASRTRGNTMQLLNGEGRVQKAFVVLPAFPWGDAGEVDTRLLGLNSPGLLMLLNEFLYCCGLSNLPKYDSRFYTAKDSGVSLFKLGSEVSTEIRTIWNRAVVPANE